MLRTLKDLFDRLAPSAAGADPKAEEHAVQLATAVMLVEVMRSDTEFHPGERAAVLDGLRERFALTAVEADQLAELAVTTAGQATDLFAFTSRINDHVDMPHKLRMIEHMWRVAYADGTLSNHERHVLWRVADLLHIPQGAYVHAKIRAREAAGAD